MGPSVLLEVSQAQDGIRGKLSKNLRTASDLAAKGDVDLATVPGLRFNDSGALLVTVRVDAREVDAVAQLIALGLSYSTASYAYESVTLIEGWISGANLVKVAAEPFVYSIDVPLAPTTRTGSVNSAGDGILRSNTARSRFATQGIDGSGTRVGVISDGVTNRSAVQGSPNFDLPTSITIDPTRPGSGNEGTAMLEIVHDLAPGAQLFFSGPATTLQMAGSINWLVGQGVKVIVDDLGWFNEPYFEDGPVAQAVASAISNGVVYVSAAGNESPDHYQAAYNQGPNSGNGFWHDFDSGAGTNIGQIVEIPPEGAFRADLQWSDAFGASTNNYDLYLRRFSDNFILDQSTDNQAAGGFPPHEFVEFTNPSTTTSLLAYVAINRVSGAARELELWTRGDSGQQYTTIGDAVFGHPAANGAVAVAAINSGDPGNDDVAFYSSRGPSTVYTNFATQTNVQRNSLDGAGIDGVETRIGQLGHFDQNPFFGTSAAAPHVAAIAALVLDANPNLTPAQVTTILNGTAIDIGTTGYDQVSGSGRFDALNSVSAAMGDLNVDGSIDRADLSILANNFGRTSALPLQGDVNGDGKVNVKDLVLLRNRCDCDGGESLMGGGGGGGGEMMGGGEEMLGGESGGEDGGESLLTETPARIYITTSGSTPGGGELPESVPSVQLDGPEDSVTLYVWASMGDYEVMQTLALDVSATNEGVVKATASTIANPNIVATNFDDEIVDTRWPEAWVSAGTLNPNGVGDEALVVGAKTGTLYTSTNAIHAAWDGTGGFMGLLDEGYDPTADAFLLGSVTLEALAGSAGLSTDIVLSIGAFKIIVGESGVAHPIYLGLGETTVDNNDVGATDGTAHATITVAAQGPSALVAGVPSRFADDSPSGAVDVATISAAARAMVRAAVRSTSAEPQRVVLRAVDEAIVSAADGRATRRPMRSSRALSHSAGAVHSLTADVGQIGL
ncbi:MAG: hypothetical protein DCC68_10745 [Planctomycetota bacterium]|nr:MAG: hypothetical protein DCC68_10745 [Planctomycetota bacterium]